MIRRGVPFPPNCQPKISNAYTKKNGQPNQFVKKVILSEDIVVALLFSQYFPLLGHRRGDGGRKHVLIAAITLIKFVTVYSQRARQSTSNAQAVFSFMGLIERSGFKSRGTLTGRQAPACLLLLYLDQTT
jgi:hypothetical protein